MNKNQISVVNHAKRSLLEKTCDLIRNFPEYLDVVVSVARKTDGRHWADLFTAAGRSTEYVLQASMLCILISTFITMFLFLSANVSFVSRWDQTCDLTPLPFSLNHATHLISPTLITM